MAAALPGKNRDGYGHSQIELSPISDAEKASPQSDPSYDKRFRRVKRGVLVDSGAGASVADTGKAFPEFTVEESEGSKRGQMFAGPGKERLPNRGQAKVSLLTKAGVGSSLVFQDASVRRPILAVKDSNRAGNIVAFDQDESIILPRDSREGREIRRLIKAAKLKIRLEEENGVFVMPAWVIPPKRPEIPFARQGVKA